MWLDLSGRLAGPGSASSSKFEAVAPCMRSSSNVLASRIISRSSIPKSAVKGRCNLFRTSSRSNICPTQWQSYTTLHFTKIVVLQEVEIANIFPHGDLLHSALVESELLGHVNVTVQKTKKGCIRGKGNKCELCSHIHLENGRVGLKRQQSSVNSLQIRKWLVKVMEFFWKGDSIVGCFSVFLRQIHNTLKQKWEHFISAIIYQCNNYDHCLKVVWRRKKLKSRRVGSCSSLPGRKAILILIKASLQSASRYLAFLW